MKKLPIILGVNIGTNSTTALYKGDKVVVCASKEKFVKQKNTVT